MPAGRPRKPTALKKLGGTLQKCRTNASEPQPLAGLPAPPEWLSSRAAEIFRAHAAIVAQMGGVSIGDGAALALLASRLEKVELCTAAIEDLGAIYHVVSKSGERVVKWRPEVAMRSEAARHAQSLLAEFGLTPAARARLHNRVMKRGAIGTFSDIQKQPEIARNIHCMTLTIW